MYFYIIMLGVSKIIDTINDCIAANITLAIQLSDLAIISWNDQIKHFVEKLNQSSFANRVKIGVLTKTYAVTFTIYHTASYNRDHLGMRPRVIDALTFQMPHHCQVCPRSALPSPCGFANWEFSLILTMFIRPLLAYF